MQEEAMVVRVDDAASFRSLLGENWVGEVHVFFVVFVVGYTPVDSRPRKQGVILLEQRRSL